MKHLKCEAQHDMAGTLETVHPDAVFEDGPVALHLRGREQAEQHYRLWWKAFQIRTEGGALYWVNDSLVIGDSFFIGKHVGSFLGIAPTNKEVRFPFTVYVSFRDGLVAQERFVYDLNGLLAQIEYAAFRAVS
jgi:hypothetical protein